MRLPVIHLKEFLGCMCAEHDFGFSIYRSVLVVWDRDYDERVLILVDRFPEEVRQDLLAIHEHKATVDLMFGSDKFFADYPHALQFDVEGDVWVLDSVHAATTENGEKFYVH